MITTVIKYPYKITVAVPTEFDSGSNPIWTSATRTEVPVALRNTDTANPRLLSQEMLPLGRHRLENLVDEQGNEIYPPNVGSVAMWQILTRQPLIGPRNERICWVYSISRFQ